LDKIGKEWGSMADTARRVLCRTCGKEVSVYDAEAYNVGRKIQYECFECYMSGSRKAQDFHARIVEKIKEKSK
jgi:hypothetical protein